MQAPSNLTTTPFYAEFQLEPQFRLPILLSYGGLLSIDKLCLKGTVNPLPVK